MTFEEWSSKREWWKRNGPFAFNKVWVGLISAGYRPADVAKMLDEIGEACAEEFGGTWTRYDPDGD